MATKEQLKLITIVHYVKKILFNRPFLSWLDSKLKSQYISILHSLSLYLYAGQDYPWGALLKDFQIIFFLNEYMYNILIFFITDAD